MKASVKLALLAGLAVILAVVLAIFLRPPAVEKPPALAKVSLRLAWLTGPTFVGDYVALDKHFWDKQGLKVSLQPGGFEFDAIKLVAAGSDTFGVTSGPQLLQARASGVPIVAIGAVIPKSPIGWVSKRDSGIERPQDFVGRRIGAQFGTHTEVTLEALCRKLQIKLDSFERIPVRFDPRPFVVGEIDVLPVYIIDQPIDLRREGLQLNIIDPWEYGVGLAYGNVYFTTEKYLKEFPANVAAFLRGAVEGWQHAESSRSEAIEILAKNISDPDRATLREKLDATFAFVGSAKGEYPGVFPMSEADWSGTANILVEHGGLSPAFSVAGAFTNTSLQASDP